MFTGLVEAMGTVCSLEADGSGGKNLIISEPMLFAQADIGESIAINGTCLTVVNHQGNQCLFQAGPETLARTNLGDLVVGDRVNLEKSMRMGDRMGGHLVTGHIDGVGTIDHRDPQGDWELVWFRCTSALAAQMVTKGSVTVDGISLTVVDVSSTGFSVALIPHTLAVTTLGLKKRGDKVNLETDLLAKYVWKYLQSVGK